MLPEPASPTAVQPLIELAPSLKFTLPVGALSERSGIADAVAMSGSHLGLAGLVALECAAGQADLDT